MAKLATIEYDDTGRARVVHSDLPERPSTEAKPPNSPQKKRVPSSPHKPFTSRNFYDLTNTVSPVNPKFDLSQMGPGATVSAGATMPNSTKERQVITIPGPFAPQKAQKENTTSTSHTHSTLSTYTPSTHTSKTGSQGPRKHPSALLPPNSTLWKSSKVDVRKPNWNKANYPPTNTTRPDPTTSNSRPPSIPSRTNATPIVLPSAPPRPRPKLPQSVFIHPESIRASSYTTPMPSMSAKQEEEALKEFFASALTPEEKDDTLDKEDTTDDNIGIIQGLKVKLMKHQIEGLEFLQDHEFTTDTKDKGKGKYGGILADDMGLGKTIQTLALILTHPRPMEEGLKSNSKLAKGTLLVVPLALADQWRREIEEKTTLKAYVHHGPKREKDPTRLARWDVVITTYDTVSSEWFNNKPTDDEEPTIHGRGIFLVNWWRIVLDEAHTIKNPKAKMSMAACALTAQFRWCLTGTPYQNTVDDVYSLVRFLRIPPFADRKYWKERITTPSKGGNTSLALTRLRTLLRAIMLRRTKDILKDNGVFIPAKEVLAEELEFDEMERAFYDDLVTRGQQVIEELKQSKGGLGSNYMCLLTMLLRLRQATDHVDLLKGKVDTDKDAIVETIKTDKLDKDVDDDLATMMSGLGIEAKCSICFTIIPTNRERCEPCELNLTTFQKKTEKTGKTSSSKIRRVLEILKTPVDEIQVKTIIFSQFTSMLDLLQPFLHDHNIKHDDGKMRKDQRDAMLHAFRTTSMPVLLVSLKSGSVGLNLTSASRVIMLDMWWNPAIEEQAIDRVHRIGQTRRVVVHKLTIRNSIDEKIGELQNKKREAASGAYGDGVIRRKGGKSQKLSLEDVLFLFSKPVDEMDD